MPLIPGGTNVSYEFVLPLLTLSVDLAATAGASKSGKTNTVGTTSGAKAVGSTGASLNLSVSVKGDKAQLPSDPKAASFPADVKNLTMALDGTVLKLTVDLSQDCGPSSSGHTTIIATSSGMKTIGGTNVLVNLNLFCKGKLHLGGDDDGEEGKSKCSSFENVEIATSGSQCSFTIDLSKDLGDSQSGKAVVIATSHQFKPVPGTDLTCSVMVCKPSKKKEEPIPESSDAALAGCDNIRWSIDGQTLALKFDTSKSFGNSSTGKSTIVASSRGMKALPGTPISVSLNVFKALEAAGKRKAEPTTTKAKKGKKDE
jgi:hypothetical protein